MLRHTGKIINTDARCAVIYMYLPEEPEYALVVNMDNCPPQFERPLRAILESQEGQSVANFYEILHRRLMPVGGVPILTALFNANLLQKVHIDQVVMVPRPSMHIPLRQVIAAVGGSSMKQLPPQTDFSAEKFNPYLENQRMRGVEERVNMARNILMEADALNRTAAEKIAKAHQIAPELAPGYVPPVAAPVQTPVAPVEAVAPTMPTAPAPQAPAPWQQPNPYQNTAVNPWTATQPNPYAQPNAPYAQPNAQYAQPTTQYAQPQQAYYPNPYANPYAQQAQAFQAHPGWTPPPAMPVLNENVDTVGEAVPFDPTIVETHGIVVETETADADTINAYADAMMGNASHAPVPLIEQVAAPAPQKPPIGSKRSKKSAS